MCFLNLGFTIPMMMSGYVQAAFGYPLTFLISSLIGLAVIPVIFMLPIPNVGPDANGDTPK